MASATNLRSQIVTASSGLIERAILVIRGHKVMLDSDLADLYQVPVKRFNEQVARNRDRFPEDFMFQLSVEEQVNLRSQFATSSWGGRRYPPYAFTEQGVAMLSSVLKSPRAVQVNIEIMRAFVLRRVVVTLAWLSPIHPRHRNYRSTALWYDVENEKLATKREDTEWRSARNGTVQHEIFEGERAAAFGEDDSMLIRVNCRPDANSFEGRTRYGLVVSLEVAEELRVPVYTEVALRIRPQVGLTVAP